MAALSRRCAPLCKFGKLFRANGIRSISGTASRYTQTESQPHPLLITTQVDGIRTICLNDPKKRNALSLNMLNQLHQALTPDSEDLRVIILRHTGPVFSAGHDLKELTDKTGREYHEEVFSTCSSVMNLVQDLPVPVIAQIHGLATAAGCQLVATSDIAVVTEQSRFATPGVAVGLFCTTPGVAVGRSVPRKVALEMMFTGQPISAHDALLHGLVSKVVPEEKLEEETMKIAKKICEYSKDVIALGKAAFYSQMSLEKKAAYRFSEKVMVENLQLQDCKEGIGAFIEKRKPNWKD
ncbi:enoyl-CoA hydratase domain-containing protein 3, mitochondrial-like [Littorina saxatilis]|uniref:Enoyl-CoA hydratase domain-containing protein 3, mitochondrial n=1 Tax=Littorina saxatilis TaxID=31220 RepID=A0AAN9AR82_9CAEN